MSEPVTQAEIEDVLSSIRRLVSEEARDARVENQNPRPESASASSDVATETRGTPRLVLTPALRIPETGDRGEESLKEGDPEAADGVSERAQMAGLADGPSQPAAEDLEGDVSDPDATIELEPGDTPEHSSRSAAEEAPWKDPWATLYQAAGVPGAEGEEAEDTTATEVPEPVLQASERVSAVVQKITELEAKVAQSKQQWEPDGLSSDPYAGTNIQTLHWEDHVEEETETVNSGASSAEDSGQDTLDADATFAATDTEARAGFADAEPLAGDDQEMARTIAEEAVAEEAFDAVFGDDAFIDEDSLRELVAEIVREELQGALGERITRNVRKLVRREIHRALAAQDLL